MNNPQVGDIWKDPYEPYHMLVVDFENDDATIVFRELETGKQYKSGRYWFSNHYHFIA
jgi:hypothetical protein